MKTCLTCQKTYPDDFSLCPHDGAHLTAQATETEAQLAAGLSSRFRLVRRLGKGGMGTVFLAEQIGVGNRPVALKVLNRKFLDDPDFLLRFQNEAGSTGRIHHPNVVTIYESAQSDDGTPYIAMEFLQGESLREVIKRRGALPLAEVAEILEQAVGGLNAAHKLGIIHRDLKPDNIFLTYPDDVGAGLVPALPGGIADTGRAQDPPLRPIVVKIVDFGIAKLRESSMHTQTGTVLGTPAYMSYEQASGMRSDELDARSDIYSLGVVVYEMLSGRTPFHSDTPVGYLRKHLMEEPPPFRAVKPGLLVEPQIESVVMKALTKDRAQRYSSVLEFAQEFAQAGEAGTHLAAQPETQRKAAKPQPQTTVTPAPKAKNRIWKKAGLGLAGLCALGVLGGGGYYAWTRCVAWRELWKLNRVCREWEREHPVGSPLDFINVKKQKDGSFLKVEWGGTQLVMSPPSGCSGTLEDTYMKFETAWENEQQRADAPANLPPNVTANEPRFEASPANLTPAPGRVRVNPKDGLKYVWIPRGTFMMGCSPGDAECQDDEKPQHHVTITKGFWLGQTEVTVGAYKRFAAATARQMPAELGDSPDKRQLNPGWGNEDMPIVNVTWHDARAFCNWAGGRLPTEAEWEHAARAGSTEAHYGPLDEVAWYADNSGPKIHVVGQKLANRLGLYDMLGNVWEWVNDWHDTGYYKRSPSQDPGGPTSGAWAELRGGSWMDDKWCLRVSRRYSAPPDSKDNFLGFRCVGEVFPP